MAIDFSTNTDTNFWKTSFERYFTGGAALSTIKPVL